MPRTTKASPWIALCLGLVLAACAPAAAGPDSAPTSAPSPLPEILPSSTGPAEPTPPPTSVPPSPIPTSLPTPRPISADDPTTFQVIRSIALDAPPSNTFASAISPDGTLVAVGGCDFDDVGYCVDETVLRLYSLDTGKTLLDLEGLSPVIETLAFSPDGKTLAVGGCDLPLYLVGELDTICDEPRLWINDLSTGKVLHDLDALKSNVTSLVFSPDGSRLHAGLLYLLDEDKVDNEIRTYDTATGERIGWLETKAYNGTVMRLHLSPDGRTLVLDGRSLSSLPSTSAWWDVTDPANPREISHEDLALSPLFSPDGSRLLLRNRKDDTFMLFDVATGERLAFYPRLGRTEVIREYLKGERLLVDAPQGMRVFDLASGEFVRDLFPAAYDHFTAIYALGPDRRTLVTAGYRQGEYSPLTTQASLWDVDTGRETLISADVLHSLTFPQRFSTDQTRLVDQIYPGAYVVWGSVPPGQAEARQALLDYLDALARGDYEAAAESLDVRITDLTDPPDMRYVGSLDEVQSLVPEASADDKAAVLEALCATPDYPCYPVGEVAYQSQVVENGYHFLVSFTDPNGEVAPWPLCQGADPSCEEPFSLFSFYVERQPDGSHQVVNGFPPAFDLRLERSAAQ